MKKETSKNVKYFMTYSEAEEFIRNKYIKKCIGILLLNKVIEVLFYVIGILIGTVQYQTFDSLGENLYTMLTTPKISFSMIAVDVCIICYYIKMYKRHMYIVKCQFAKKTVSK